MRGGTDRRARASTHTPHTTHSHFHPGDERVGGDVSDGDKRLHRLCLRRVQGQETTTISTTSTSTTTTTAAAATVRSGCRQLEW